MYQSLRINPEDCSVLDLFDRILEKGIVFDPWARVALVSIDLRQSSDRIVVAPERRHLPFIVPPNADRSSELIETEQRPLNAPSRLRRKAAKQEQH